MRMNTTGPQTAINADGDYAIGPSRVLAAILLLSHFSIAGLLLYLGLGPIWTVAALVLLLCSLVYETRIALRAGNGAVVVLRIASDNRLSIGLRDGRWHEGEVLGSTTVTAFLTVINLRVIGERRMRSVVILPDCMAPEDYRRLRVWLRWRPHPETS